MFKKGWNKTNIPYISWGNTEVYLESKRGLFELAVAYRKEYVFWNNREKEKISKKILIRVKKNKKSAEKLCKLFFRAYKNNDFEE